MSTSSWQQAWIQAQPHLQAIRHSLPHFPGAGPRVLRVGQLDAELLDQELLQILTAPPSRALGLIQTSYRSRFEPELTLLVNLTLYKFSMWDLGATYGAKLQNLHYKVQSTPLPRSLAPSGLPRAILWAHAAVTIIIPYLHSRLRIHALSREWPDMPSADWRRKAWALLTRIESLQKALDLASLIAFLCDGRYRTWAGRLLHLRLTPLRGLSTREVSYEFMNRQMVWHAFTEFILFLLPLVNSRILRRRTARALSQISLTRMVPPRVMSVLGFHQPTDNTSSERATARQGKYGALSEDQCAICAEDASFSINDINDPLPDAYTAATVTLATSSSFASTKEPPRFPIQTPYVSSCGHVYCYVCLSERMLRAADDGELGWRCLRCVGIVVSAGRVQAAAAEEILRDDHELDGVSVQSDNFLYE